MTIKLQPGDYVDLKGHEDKYEQVLKAFVDAGANDFDGGDPKIDRGFTIMRWDSCNDVWCDSQSSKSRISALKREITIGQILGTEPTLPAIGTKWIECEDGDVVEVVAHHRDAIVCWSEDEGYRPYDVSELLPLDEREREILEMMSDAELMRVQAERAYDAGYRKQ